MKLSLSDSMASTRTSRESIKHEVVQIDGVVDARIIQRLDYPEYIIDVDRAKVADLKLNQTEVMKNVVAALNSSIQFYKKNFWIDPVSKNQYFVRVQYFEEVVDSVETLLDVPITGFGQDKPIPLRNVPMIELSGEYSRMQETRNRPFRPRRSGLARELQGLAVRR
jgi:Cu/Ag efflux pump CusA